MAVGSNRRKGGHSGFCNQAMPSLLYAPGAGDALCRPALAGLRADQTIPALFLSLRLGATAVAGAHFRNGLARVRTPPSHPCKHECDQKKGQTNMGRRNHHPKTEVTVAGRWHKPVAAGRARVVGIVEPPATAHHAP